MSKLLDATAKLVEAQDNVNKIRLEQYMLEELLDDDGYPTWTALEIIKLWHWSDKKGWFEFIKSIWWSRDWGWTEGYGLDDHIKNKKHTYNISTGGWSGNESIIEAMQENTMMWHFTWVQSRRGGHYIFERGIE